MTTTSKFASDKIVKLELRNARKTAEIKEKAIQEHELFKIFEEVEKYVDEWFSLRQGNDFCKEGES